MSRRPLPNVMYDRFSLGFPGEEWSRRLRYLNIPVPGTTHLVLVQRTSTSDGVRYIIAGPEMAATADDILTATAIVHNWIEELTDAHIQD